MRHQYPCAEEPHAYCSAHAAADCSRSFLSLHEEIGSKPPILLWRVFWHCLTRFLGMTNDVACTHQRRNDEGPHFARGMSEHELAGKSLSVLYPAIAFAERVGIKRHQSCTAFRQLPP